MRKNIQVQINNIWLLSVEIHSLTLYLGRWVRTSVWLQNSNFIRHRVFKFLLSLFHLLVDYLFEHTWIWAGRASLFVVYNTLAHCSTIGSPISMTVFTYNIRYKLYKPCDRFILLSNYFFFFICMWQWIQRSLILFNFTTTLSIVASSLTFRRWLCAVASNQPF